MLTPLASSVFPTIPSITDSMVCCGYVICKRAVNVRDRFPIFGEPTDRIGNGVTPVTHYGSYVHIVANDYRSSIKQMRPSTLPN